MLGQKLAYIYGFPTLLNERGKLTESAVNLLTIFVGVMTGVGIAVKTLQELGEILQKQIIKKLPEYGSDLPLSKKASEAGWYSLPITRLRISP